MKYLLFLLTILPMSLFAQHRPGFNAEPYAGYYTGEVTSAAFSDGDIRSFTAGAKLGYQTEGGWVFGIDYAQGNGDYEIDSGSEYDLITKDGGIFIGYHFPAYLRVWASYILQYELELKDFPSDGSSFEAEGTGYNVGLSLRGIPFVSVSLTYAKRELDERNGVSLSGDNTVETTMLSLSLPYNFPWKP